MKNTFTVLFSGTGHKASDTNTLVYLLKEHLKISAQQNLIFFDGCSIANEATELSEAVKAQCQQVSEQIKNEIATGNTVILNVYGLIQGGFTGLLLAESLADIKPELLEINLALLDPVPASLVLNHKLDTSGTHLADPTINLSSCKSLKNVLALYSYEPSPSLTAHTPLFIDYPHYTKVEEDVIVVCHSASQFQNDAKSRILFKPDNFISFARIVQFLKNCGSEFTLFPPIEIEGLPQLKVNIDQLDQALLPVYEFENKLQYKKHRRDTLSSKGAFISTKEKAAFLNAHHQKLVGHKPDKRSVRMTIEKEPDPKSSSVLGKTIVFFGSLWKNFTSRSFFSSSSPTNPAQFSHSTSTMDSSSHSHGGINIAAHSSKDSNPSSSSIPLSSVSSLNSAANSSTFVNNTIPINTSNTVQSPVLNTATSSVTPSPVAKSNSSPDPMSHLDSSHSVSNTSENTSSLTPNPTLSKSRPDLSYIKNMNMQVLYGFMMIAGAFITALAFIFLSATALLIVAGIGTSIAATGFGFFVHNVSKDNKEVQDTETMAPHFSKI